MERLLKQAQERRAPLIEALPHTDCYRLFHGVAEGRPGVAIDRYGSVLQVQTWREPLLKEELALIERVLGDGLTLAFWNRRDKTGGGDMPVNPTGTELGLRFDVTPPHAHRGQDPLLFLDFRAARRWVAANSQNKSVLNLFAYTCGIGLAAAVGKASEVLNVDFAESALGVGQRNASLNSVQMATMHSDVFPVIRQLAGLNLGRGRRLPAYAPVQRRTYDLIVLDPPRWAQTPWGAVGVVRDYGSLFKPCALSVSDGGVVFATNHVPSVDSEQWISALRKCALKAGRPVRDIELLKPEADFPSFDDRPPLKMAICRF